MDDQRLVGRKVASGISIFRAANFSVCVSREISLEKSGWKTCIEHGLVGASTKIKRGIRHAVFWSEPSRSVAIWNQLSARFCTGGGRYLGVISYEIKKAKTPQEPRLSLSSLKSIQEVTLPIVVMSLLLVCYWLIS